MNRRVHEILERLTVTVLDVRMNAEKAEEQLLAVAEQIRALDEELESYRLEKVG